MTHSPLPAQSRLFCNAAHQSHRAFQGRRCEAGFTLLELMAVIVIIGIVISFASLSIGQNSSRIVQDEAERLHGLIQLAAEETVLQGRELALEFNHDRYQFLELGSNGWQRVEQDKMFRERPLPENVELELTLEGVEASFADPDNLPRIFILSSGELTPFSLSLSADEVETYSLQGSINGKLVLARANDDGS
ncbi:MAG: type II secretion system minor pseudopilin GspH [Gammaproteobacteria bacterium]|nr:type II secretion system minor pseudopilin GspH [Gammaproteobacteria bacterium]